MLQWAEMSLPLGVDAVTGSGQVLRAALEHRRVGQGPVVAAEPKIDKLAPKKASFAVKKSARQLASAGPTLDLNSPAGYAGEMALLMAPVGATHARLSELLEVGARRSCRLRRCRL